MDVPGLMQTHAKRPEAAGLDTRWDGLLDCFRRDVGWGAIPPIKLHFEHNLMPTL